MPSKQMIAEILAEKAKEGGLGGPRPLNTTSVAEPKMPKIGQQAIVASPPPIRFGKIKQKLSIPKI